MDTTPIPIRHRLRKAAATPETLLSSNTVTNAKSNSAAPPVDRIERKRRVEALAKKIALTKRLFSSLYEDTETSSQSFNEEEEEEEEEEEAGERPYLSPPSPTKTPLRQYKAHRQPKFIAFSNDVCYRERDDPYEDEMKDFICDDTDSDSSKFRSKANRRRKSKLHKLEEDTSFIISADEHRSSESDGASDTKELALRRQYDELFSGQYTAMESLSFSKAFRRYIMYLALSLLSPNWKFPFIQETGDTDFCLQAEKEEESERQLDKAYFQPAIDKTEKYIFSRRDQYDTKPFPNSFKELLSKFSMAVGGDEAYFEEGICIACHTYREFLTVLELHGETYDAARMWADGVEEWYRATETEWLGRYAFPQCSEEKKLPKVVRMSPPSLSRSIPTEERGSNTDETRRKNLAFANDDARSSDETEFKKHLSIGRHCLQQALKWHKLQHYKYELLHTLYKELQSFDEELLSHPIAAAKRVKKLLGPSLYKEFESIVLNLNADKKKRK